MEHLKSHSDGLIACSACLASVISKKLRYEDSVRKAFIDNYDDIVYTINWFREAFYGEYYLEIQDHNFWQCTGDAWPTFGHQVQQPVPVRPGFLRLGFDLLRTQAPVALPLAVHLVKDRRDMLGIPLATRLLECTQCYTDRLPY